MTGLSMACVFGRTIIPELWNAVNKFSSITIFDSTRRAFLEGGPAFPGAGIHKKSHIQICIRNINCIKGFFIPREKVQFPSTPASVSA